MSQPEHQRNQQDAAPENELGMLSPALTTGHTDHNKESGSTTYRGSNNGINGESQWGRDKWIVYGQFWFNAILATFAVIGGCIALGQLNAIKDQNTEFIKQNKTMRKQTRAMVDQVEVMEREQRPWLSVVTPEITEPFADGKKIQCRMLCKNTGPSPGRILRHRLFTHPMSAAATIDSFIALYERRAGEKQQPTIVPPEGATLLEFADAPTMDTLMIGAIGGGNVKLYIIGEFFYSDPSKAMHRTAFFFEYHPVPGNPTAIGRFLMRGEYSEMD